MKRGIITTPSILTELPSGGFRQERNLNIDEIRYYSLYFDQVVIPTNNFIHFSLEQEEELINLKLIERPRYNITGTLNSNDYPKYQLDLQYKELEKRNSNSNEIIWNLHQMGGNKIYTHNENVEIRTNLIIELYNLLPVPVGKISFEEILKFKEYRKDELNILHDTLEELYLEILKSPDSDLTKKKIINTLNKNILDLQKVSKEKWNEFRYFSLNTNFNMKDVSKGAFEGYGIAEFIGFIGEKIGLLSNNNTELIKILGAAIGTLSSAINIKVKEQNSLKNEKLNYISNASKEGIVKIKNK
ncbi:DUF6236 family protein [Arcobacter defluvii]|uniref:Uncharacterized protein n=1 Tax=Arcobacter defluvii TaxID=873191 RepID=A0AAE7E7B8_9BACT|nr:DUF6236 family protein [Arcobacter defluvii]QKF77183.1 hypothetical protein ADFLV_1150 [Arcobacter defluvii]RXI33527.1 hypothetical protein CP964_05910 [Arcobacter defluvii]